MSPSRKAPPAAVVGLDIGTDSIKVSEARFAKDGISITGMGIARTPEGVIDNEVIVDPKGLGEAVKRLLAETGIKTKQCVSSVAGQSRVVVRVIEVPKMSRNELAETMKWEVERHVPFSPSQVVMDFQPLEKPNQDPDAQNMEVLLAVAQDELIDSHVQMLQAAGLKPVAIDIEPLAAGRALISAAANGTGDEVVAVVNIGNGYTDLGIFENDILTFPSPPLSIAGISFTREIAEATGETLEQAETTKKEYAVVRLDGFGGGAPDASPVPDAAPADIDGATQMPSAEPTSFGTSVGPAGGAGFVVGGSSFEDDEPAAKAEEAPAAAEPGAFQDTTDGPVFDSPLGVPAFDIGDSTSSEAPSFDLGSTEQPEPSIAPSFDLGDDEPAAPAAEEGTGEPQAAAPAPFAFDLDDDGPTPAAEEPAAPHFDLGDAQTAAAPVDEPAPVPAAQPVAFDPQGGSMEDRVFEAISGVLVDLANELRRSIEYYNTRYSRVPDRIVLCGGTAKMPHLDEFLSRELGMPVTVADPVKNVKLKMPGASDRYVQEISPLFSVSIGLAIRDMIG